MKIPLILLFLMISESLVHGQFLKGLGEKVERSIERTIEHKAEQKAEKATSKAIDEALHTPTNKNNVEKKTKADTTAPKNSEGITDDNFWSIMDAVQKEAKYASSYAFDYQIIIEVTNYKKGIVKNTDRMTTLIGNESWGLFQDENKETLLIYDNAHESSLTLDMKKKTGTAISMAFMKSMSDMTSSETNQDYEIKKTGKSKTIGDYRCEEYHIIYDDMLIESWITTDENQIYKRYLDLISGMLGGEQNWGTMYFAELHDLNGFPIQSKTYQNDKLMSKSEIIHIMNKSLTYSMNQFEIDGVTGKTY